LKIRAHTIAQIFGLADVDDFSRGVFVQVNAGRARNFFEFFFESHGFFLWYAQIILAL
jgi:hypothetical protein